jgi:uncharacterized protein (TIGR03437 family)
MGWLDAPAAPGATAAPLYLSWCDGGQGLYQAQFEGAAERRFALNDLGETVSRTTASSSGPAAYRVAGGPGRWLLTPQETSLDAVPFLHAATLAPVVAPGTVLSIFGAGLAGEGAPTSVEIGGLPAEVISAAAFRLSVVVPAQLTPGYWPVKIRSPFGVAESSLALVAAAPGIWTTSGNRAVGTNPDGKPNALDAPASRNQTLDVYVTGLAANLPSKIYLDGLEPAVTGIRAAAGAPGIAIVSIRVPAALAPGPAVKLWIVQDGVASNLADVTVQ